MTGFSGEAIAYLSLGSHSDLSWATILFWRAAMMRTVSVSPVQTVQEHPWNLDGLVIELLRLTYLLKSYHLQAQRWMRALPRRLRRHVNLRRGQQHSTLVSTRLLPPAQHSNMPRRNQQHKATVPRTQHQHNPVRPTKTHTLFCFCGTDRRAAESTKHPTCTCGSTCPSHATTV